MSKTAVSKTPVSKTPVSKTAVSKTPVSKNQIDALPIHVPWYYATFVRLAKPLYRLKLWRKLHSDSGEGVDEVSQRFGHAYPPRPICLKLADKLADTNGKNGDPNSSGANILDDNSNEDPEHLASAHAQRLKHALQLLQLRRSQEQPVVWCHAVSLGETNTITPLLNVLLQAGMAVWLTNTTQTGFAQGQKTFATAIERGQLSQSFVPVDDPAVMQRFLAHVRPSLALFVETELWATTLAQLKTKAIPSVLVNARLSAKSFAGYQKMARLSLSMMHNVSLIIAQDDDSAKRYRKLGAQSWQIRRAESLKWASVSTTDVGHAEQHQLPDLVPTKRPIWVAASTHEGEEALVLAAHRHVCARHANALLILVPRHPERFDAVAQLLEKQDINHVRRSQCGQDLSQLHIDDAVSVLLADSMGELMTWYANADVAMVGGSLIDGIGGHNPIEPASLAKPIIMGKFVQSCADVAAALSAVNALYVVEASVSQDIIEGLANQVAMWLTNDEQAHQAGKAGQALMQDKSRAMSQQLAMIADLCEQFSSQ